MTEDLTRWKRFQFYVPGVGKLMFVTDGEIVRMIGTALRPGTAKLVPCSEPAAPVPVMSPEWDRAAAGPKPEWFDDPRGTCEWLRRERDGLEADARALYAAMDKLHLQALLRGTEGHKLSDYHAACGAASVLMDRLREKGYGLPRRSEVPETKEVDRE